MTEELSVTAGRTGEGCGPVHRPWQRASCMDGIRTTQAARSAPPA